MESHIARGKGLHFYELTHSSISHSIKSVFLNLSMCLHTKVRVKGKGRPDMLSDTEGGRCIILLILNFRAKWW